MCDSTRLQTRTVFGAAPESVDDEKGAPSDLASLDRDLALPMADLRHINDPQRWIDLCA